MTVTEEMKKNAIDNENFKEEKEMKEMKEMKNEVSEVKESKLERAKAAWKKMPLGKKVKVLAVGTLGLVAAGAIVLAGVAAFADENEDEETYEEIDNEETYEEIDNNEKEELEELEELEKLDETIEY